MLAEGWKAKGGSTVRAGERTWNASLVRRPCSRETVPSRASKAPAPVKEFAESHVARRAESRFTRRHVVTIDDAYRQEEVAVENRHHLTPR